MTIQYIGRRHAKGTEVFVIGLRGEEPLPPRADLRNHSPTGFEWGYSGSGPAQLALAMLSHALDDDVAAQSLYQRFKFRYVVQFAHEGWAMTRDEVRSAVRAIVEDKAF